MPVLGLEGMVFVAAMIGLFGAIIAYYIAKIIGSVEMESAWKMELVESILSVLLIIVIFDIATPLLSQALQNYVSDVYGGQPPMLNTPEAQLLYDTPIYVVYYRLELSQDYLEKARVITMILASLSRSSSVEYQTGNNPYIALGFGVWGNLANNLYNNVLSLLYLFLLTKKLFIVVPYVAQIMIPAGAMLRAFPPTRGVGAYLLAFGFTLYYLFPVIFISFVGPKPPAIYDEVLGPFNPVLEGIRSTVEAIQEFTSNPFGQAIGIGASGTLVLLPTASLWMPIVLGLGFSSVSIWPLIQIVSHFHELMGAFMVDMIFAPYAAFALAISLISMISTIIGAKIPEIGRGLVKFI